MAGFLQQSNDIVNNATNKLDEILSSTFNQFIQGLGQPVLTTYYNVNDTLSTADRGTETIDSIIGPDSPVRYNKIENFPLYGAFKDMTLDMLNDDGLIDLDMDVEGVLLPDTIRPSELDYVEYRFGVNKERRLLFRVNNVVLTSIKSNSYYKINCNLKAIDDEAKAANVDKQVCKTMETNLDMIGSNEKCIIETTNLKKVRKLQDIRNSFIDQYIDLFYNKRYNSLILKGYLANGYIYYDPYITNFIINNNLLDTKDHFITLVNFDTGDGFRQIYNKTFFHAVELKDIKLLKEMRFSPITFSKVNTNPFTYYGEEIVFKLDLYEDEPTAHSPNIYMPIKFLNNIELDKDSQFMNRVERLIMKYFNSEQCGHLIDDEFTDFLSKFVLEYDDYWFRFTPILIYIMNIIIHDLNNAF
jgi:hypothetical protein